MITIETDKTNKYGRAILKIEQGTSYTTLVLGAEMLIEALIKETNQDIDFVLEDIKRIYYRDNESGEEVGKTSKTKKEN